MLDIKAVCVNFLKSYFDKYISGLRNNNRSECPAGPILDNDSGVALADRDGIQSNILINCL